MKTLHPSCIHILRWSLKRSVKQTWTGFFAFFHQWKCLNCNNHGLLVSCVKWHKNPKPSTKAIEVENVHYTPSLPPKRWFLKTNLVTMNIVHSMPRRNPCRLQTCSLRWSLKRRSVKRTWTTGSAFPTNESAWRVTVMGSHSRVWSYP